MQFFVENPSKTRIRQLTGQHPEHEFRANVSVDVESHGFVSLTKKQLNELATELLTAELNKRYNR